LASHWQTEFGSVYGRVLAHADGASGAGTARIATLATASPADAAAAARAQLAVLSGQAVGVAGLVGGVRQSSGYAAGSMRELSLVALGGGGVLVQRLEAHEMGSMWQADHPELV
jgi:hypothetical protein